VQQCVARDAFHQAENGAFATGADDRICLPIANANTLFYNGGSLIDVDAARDYTASGKFAGPLIVFLAAPPELAEQGAAGMLVAQMSW